MRTRKPRDGKCQLCTRRVGSSHLVWHHCHTCGIELGWLCDDCNLPLTEHLLANWERAHKFVQRHECAAAPIRMFDVDAVVPLRRVSSSTRTVHFSNGGGDGRTYQASTVSGHVSVEQLAAVLGVNANTARDLINGRKNGRRRGQQIDGTWHVPHNEVLAILDQRWNRNEQSTALR